MFWRILRRRGVIPLVLILIAIAYWRLHSPAPKVLSIGYVADRDVTLWNTLAEVKQPVAELHYGERVEILREEGSAAEVRTASNMLGWMMDSRQIMDSDLWVRSAALLARARTLPPQAWGRTKTVSNVRIEPGRDGKRVFQFLRGTPVVVLERKVVDAPQASGENSQDEKTETGADQKPKAEDWLLVMRSDDAPAGGESSGATDNSSKPVSQSSSGPVSGGADGGAVPEATPTGPIAGWVLARFIDLNLPGPVRDYASSSDLHVLAWFELNRVPDGSGGEAPQYLVAGSRGGEGQDCDFTMLRVYTWGIARKRYETAYVESDLCGRLPIRVSQGAKGPEFQFAEMGGSAGERKYFMQQTSVRREKDTTFRPSRLHE